MSNRRSTRLHSVNNISQKDNSRPNTRQSMTYGKSLNVNEICENLDLSEDEAEINHPERNIACKSFKIKLKRLSDQINYKIINQDKPDMTEKRNTRSSTNYKVSESQRLNSSKRRPVKETSDLFTSEDEDSEVDENKMDNANTTLSPKRHRSENTPNNSPIKHNLRTPRSCTKSSVSMNTPTKAMKNLKMSESTPTKGQKYKINSKTNLQITLTPQHSKNKYSEKEKHKANKEFDEDYCPEEYDSEDADETSDFQCNDESEETDSEDECNSDDSDFSSIYSPKKRSKQSYPTKNKTPRNSTKTPSKSAKNISKMSMETPTKQLSRLSLHTPLTPSMHHRTANIIKPSTPLQEARLKLHVSVLPKSLPCREEQFNDIYSFLHARLSDRSGGCIYISGVPGTGKTATVNEVIRCLNKSMNAGKLTKFEFIDINGMKLSEPRQAYVQIWKQLTGKSTTWEEAHKLLHERFTKPNSKRDMTLLLVDELDLLCTKRQDVVYNLLDWPSKIDAKLVVVTIANTMDLPERILMGKVTSRLGLTRLTFPPYNHRQLEEIVISRLKGHNAFGGETIQLVARKVAAVSGDARRALDICRRATEVAEMNGREMVSMVDVKKALDEMIASPKIQAIKHCSDFEKYFLQAVCAEVTRTGVEEVVFKNVYFQLESLCSLNGEKKPNVSEALSMCARLGSWRLLLCDHSKMDIHQRLLLNVSTDDVNFAIQNI